MSNATLPDWERLLSSAARLQKIPPGAVLVGGTAASVHVHHRFSCDADHTLTNMKEDFDGILQKLESVAGLEEGNSSCGACRSASF